MPACQQSKVASKRRWLWSAVAVRRAVRAAGSGPGGPVML
jgi:hypothetical protein